MYAAAEIMFYNRGNSSKNNKTYPISDFGSLEDITTVVLQLRVTLYISRHVHSISTSHGMTAVVLLFRPPQPRHWK